jgi:hypothetical protein
LLSQEDLSVDSVDIGIVCRSCIYKIKLASNPRPKHGVLVLSLDVVAMNYLILWCYTAARRDGDECSDGFEGEQVEVGF